MQELLKELKVIEDDEPRVFMYKTAHRDFFAINYTLHEVMIEGLKYQLPLFSVDNDVVWKDIFPTICFRSINSNKVTGCRHKLCDHLKTKFSLDMIEEALRYYTTVSPKEKKRKAEYTVESPKAKRGSTGSSYDSETESSTLMEEMPIIQLTRNCNLYRRQEPIICNNVIYCKKENTVFVSSRNDVKPDHTIALAADNLFVTKGITFIPMEIRGSIKGEELDQDQVELENGIKGDLVIDTCGMAQFISPCDQIIDGVFAHLHYVEIKDSYPLDDLRMISFQFKDWKNATFPLRNENEMNIKRLLSLICNAKEITMPWEYELNERDRKDLVCLTEVECANGKPFCFEKKELWTGWLKKKSTSNPRNDRLNELKNKLHNDKGFTMVIHKSDQPNALQFIEEYKKFIATRDSHLQVEFQLCQEGFDSTRLIAFNDGTPKFIETERLLHCSEHTNNESAYVLIKPHGLMPHAIKCILNNWHDVRVTDFKMEDTLKMEVIESLYPNCKNRPYGPEWINYLTSGPVIHINVKCKSLQILRNRMVKAREESNYIWTRNIVHCSANAEEAKDNLRMYYDQV